MNRVLVYGGTFDPVHRGHIESVLGVVQLLGDVNAYLVPCKIPAHRPQPVASPEDRLKMLELAIGNRHQIFVDDSELRRDGVSYTFDTLAGYRRKLGKTTPLFFLMGYDSWVTLPKWYRWQEIVDLAHLLVLERPGVKPAIPEPLQSWSEPREVDALGEVIDEASGNICFVSVGQIDVSASGLRQSLVKGDVVKGDMSPRVLKYVKQQKLYTMKFR